MMKGALVEMMSAFGASVPNVVIFQFNPETLRHTLSQSAAATTQPGQSGSNPLAVSGVPSETFGFSLAMDVTDQFADPDPTVKADAKRFGIYARIAALETLLYPSPPSDQPTGGSTNSGSSNSSGGEKRPTPAAQLPTVLFVWGTGRILPVRVLSLTITEKLYDEDLNPTHADAQLELRVLTPAELQSLTGTLKDIATGAYAYSQKKRELFAAANLGDAGRAVIGMVKDAHLPGFG
jgi:hypothetical protein